MTPRSMPPRSRHAAVSWWLAVSNVGLKSNDITDMEARRKVRALNQFVVIASASGMGYAVVQFLAAPDLAVAAIANVVVALLHLTTYWHIARGRVRLAVSQFLLLCNGGLAVVSYTSDASYGFHFYFFAFACVVFLLAQRRHWFHYPWALVSVALLLYFDNQPKIVDTTAAFAFRMVTMAATAFTLGLIAYLFDDDAREAEQDLEREHERSEELLLNVLPATISERLKGGDKSIADGFADVSVVFADIVGFTLLSQQLDPDELVRVLNHVFSRFDELAERLGVEKIKTIGDAYMAAVGLPQPNPDHAAVATEMALSMRDVVAELNDSHGFDLGVRVGVNSGPVVAGVIGKKKFIYDLWGDTVNTASRMESHGVAGAVHVSEATAADIRGRFHLEERGDIEIKGKGTMKTFLVERRTGA